MLGRASVGMLTQVHIDRRVVYGFITLMLIVNAAVFFVLWKQIKAGRNDFPIFYSNAQMVREGHARGLYDFEAENDVVRRVSDVARPPNNHLPYELLLFVPLTYLPFGSAYILWTLLGLGMLAGMVALMRNNRTEEWSFASTLVVVVAFFPVSFCLLMGHDSILLLFLFTVSL